MKPEILLLTHRIPFPPNKGDKIRSFHLLEFLSRHYRVHLGTFIDVQDDWKYVPTVQGYCVSSRFFPLHPRAATIKSMRGLLSGQALTLPYYANATLEQWVRKTVEDRDIRRVLVFSSAMAQFVMGSGFRQTRRLIDFVDVDSNKWEQYAESRKWPLSWVYRREAKKLLQYEKRIAESFDVSLFVSAAEADVFSELSGVARGSISYVTNGVDSAYFSPDHDYPNPYRAGQRVVVFVGAMDYWANVEAVCWLAKDALPSLRRKYPEVHFYVVGARPADAVERLAGLPGITVTGGVPDVRPYVRYASAVVAPLRIARGIQNKVLEAMAMAKPVVATAQALEGIDAIPGKEVCLANDAQAFVQRIGAILDEGGAHIGRAARAKVRAEFNWSHSLHRVGALLEDQPPYAAVAEALAQ